MIRDDNSSGIVKPLFEENIEFEFLGQYIDELNKNAFFINKDEDPHDYISNITDIIDLFHSPEVSRDQVMLMAFLFTLKGMDKQWMRQLSTSHSKKIPLKERDLESFTIPCVIGKSGITKALAHLGASISLMPYPVFLRLDIGELKPTRMCIELANKSTQFPRRIAENVIVKVDKFVFPIDFVVLDMEENHKIPIILGRPFIATTHAMIDVFNKKISFEVGDETITIDIDKSMRFPPSNDDTCNSVDMVDLTILDHVQEILFKHDVKPSLIRRVLLLQEFTNEIKDKKGSKNLAADHQSRLENSELEELDEDAIRDSFPDEHLMVVNIKDVENDLMCQNLQVQVMELKSVKESLNLSVEELYKALALVEATLRERDELVFAQCEKIRLLEEQRELFYEEMGDKVKCFDDEKRVFENKMSKMEKVIAQRVKDFDDVKTELSKRTDKFKTYFVNLEKENALLKSQLASQNYTSL
nr:hypothetical protein [Tanacetum cinerariifolium]